MQLNEYFCLPEEHTLSASEVQALNAVLSHVTAQAVPEEKRAQILDYLKTALLFGTIDDAHRPGIERLFSELNNDP